MPSRRKSGSPGKKILVRNADSIRYSAFVKRCAIKAAVFCVRTLLRGAKNLQFPMHWIIQLRFAYFFNVRKKVVANKLCAFE